MSNTDIRTDNQEHTEKQNKAISTLSILRKITVALYLVTACLFIVCLSGRSFRLLSYDICNYKVIFHESEDVLRVFIIGFIILLGFLLISLRFEFIDEGVELVLRCKIGYSDKTVKIRPFSILSYIVRILILIIVCSVLLWKIPGKLIIRDHATWNGDILIGHAGGNIEDNPYTNSKDAVVYNYGRGIRTFEIDFSYTSDGYLVCKHDWGYNIQDFPNNDPVDKATFVASPIMGKYEAMSIDDLFAVMKEYPDIYIVTDTKDYEKELIEKEFNSLVRSAKEDDALQLLDRLIIQIYDEDMYYTLSDIYPFSNYIYTLYQFWDGTPDVFESCARFCYDNKIHGITCWNYFVTPKIVNIAEKYGIDLYAHTENDIKEADRLLSMGVRGLYTDSLDPKDFLEDKR